MAITPRTTKAVVLLALLLAVIGIVSRSFLTADPLQIQKSTHNVLVTRGDEQSWSQAVTKGQTYIDLLNSDCAPQSIYTQESDLRRYGWVQGAPEGVLLEELNPVLVQMWDDWKLPDPSSEAKARYQADHDESSTHNGKTYPPTEGIYTNVFSPTAIIAEHNYGPTYMGGEMTPPITGADIVPMNRWSDLVFLQWQLYCNDDQAAMQELKYIVRLEIATAATKDILAQALEKHQAGLTIQHVPWSKRIDFDVHSQQAQAIMSTPHGSGVAWFLAQHRSQLGWKTVSKIWIFNGAKAEDESYQLVFELMPGGGAGSGGADD